MAVNHVRIDKWLGCFEDDAVASYVGSCRPVVPVSLASSKVSEPATELTSECSDTTNGALLLDKAGAA